MNLVCITLKAANFQFPKKPNWRKTKHKKDIDQNQTLCKFYAIKVKVYNWKILMEYMHSVLQILSLEVSQPNFIGKHAQGFKD